MIIINGVIPQSVQFSTRNKLKRKDKKKAMKEKKLQSSLPPPKNKNKNSFNKIKATKLNIERFIGNTRAFRFKVSRFEIYSM